MPPEVIPEMQRIILAPYKGRLFEFNPVDNRYFIHSYVTRYFTVYGENCIIRGLEPVSWQIDPDNIVTINISGGIAIADSTCLVIRGTTTLDLDVSPYDEKGRLVVSLGYKNYHSIEENEPYLKLSYVTVDGSSQAPLPWRSDKDRLLLGYFAFVKASADPPHSGQLINLTPRKDADPVYIYIAGKQYQVAPYDSISRAFFRQRVLLVGMEVVKLTPQDIQRGYLEIDDNYLDTEVEVSIAGGLVLTNASVCPPGIVPDYEVYRGRIHLRNGIYGDYEIVGLSDELQAGDVLRIEYYY